MSEINTEDRRFGNTISNGLAAGIEWTYLEQNLLRKAVFIIYLLLSWTHDEHRVALP